MRTEDKVLSQLKRWAEEWNNVRALILTSSRADSHSETDMLSDYDVEVYVNSIEPVVHDDVWLNKFGDIMVRWPSSPRSTFSNQWITQLALFDDGVRIDFQFTAQDRIDGCNLDNEFRVMVDKDGMSKYLPKSTYTQYLVTRPTADKFDARLNAFWWDIVYVAKGLWRNELNYAKSMLDGTIRHDKLKPLIEWHIGIKHRWSVNPGVHGRWFHRYLDPSLWEHYKRTFADANLENNWNALFETIDFARILGKDIAKEFGFSYPYKVDKNVTQYISKIKGS